MCGISRSTAAAAAAAQQRMQNANTFPLCFDCCIDMQIDCQIVVIVGVIVLLVVVVVAVLITAVVVVTAAAAAATTVSPSPMISAGGSPVSGSRRCDLGLRRRWRHPKTPAARKSSSHSKYPRRETEVIMDIVNFS